MFTSFGARTMTLRMPRRPAPPRRRRRPAPALQLVVGDRRARPPGAALTLPLIWTTQVTVSSTRYAGSATGKGSWTTERCGPGAPQLLGDVRGQRRDQQHQRLDRGAGRRRHLVRWLFSSVTLAMAVLKRRPARSCRDAVDRLVQRAQGLLVGASSDDDDLAGRLVDDVAPQPLQQPVLADHRAGVPRAGDVQRAHRHLVQAQGVGAVLGADLVRGDRVLQGLAHLAQQPRETCSPCSSRRRRAPRPRRPGTAMPRLSR